MPRPDPRAIPLLLLAILASSAAAARETVERPRNGLGFAVSVLPTLDAPDAGAEDAAGPLWLLIDGTPHGASDDPGDRWSGYDGEPVADLLRSASGDTRVVIRLAPDGVLEAPDEESFLERHEPWIRSVRTLARRFREDAAWLLLELPSGVDARRLDFVVKSFAITARAESRTTGIAVSVRGADAADEVRALFGPGGLNAYVDAVALDLGGRAIEPAPVNALAAALVDAHPAGDLWITGAGAGSSAGDGGAAIVRGFVTALELGARLVAFADADGGASSSPVVPRLRTLLDPGVGLAGPTASPLRFVDGAGEAAEVRHARFFDAATFRVAMVYWGDAPAGTDETVRLELDGRLASRPRVESLVTGEGRSRGFRPVDGAPEGTVSIALPVSPEPRVLVYQAGVATPGVDLSPEELEVRRVRGLTAEEIIARHQRYQSWQDERLHSYHGRGRIDFHFRFGSITGSLDLQVRGGFFWDRATGMEWSFDEIYFNGVKSSWDRLPEIPFISRSEVVNVPLDIDLDKRYAYERLGDEVVDGRDCFQLRFRPLESDVALYRGRTWIDKATYAMVRVSSEHTEVTPPTISVSERILFRPVSGPDGLSYWTMAEVDSEEIRTINARNLVVERTVTFDEIRVNDPTFLEEREEAYASTKQMIRETPTGLKWLERQEDGSRRETEGQKDALFLLGGVLRDESTDGTLPLAGINYTNIDLFDRDWILNVFFAGAFANVNLSNPSVAGTRLDFGVSAGLFGFAGTDRVYEMAEEIEEDQVDIRPQSLTLNFGYPLGDFVKLRASYGADWLNYGRTDDTDGFTPPSDTLEQTGLLELALDWRGWGLRARGSYTSRGTWDPWGRDGELVRGEELRRTEEYTRWSGQLFKSFYLPFFQKIEISGEWFGGEDLDRFSQYRFGFLGGTRVRGYGGSGIRFEEGAIYNVEYAFSIAEAVRFDLDVDHAVVKDFQLSMDSTSHTGVGVAANFLGPWRTAFRLDFGYALSSDLEQAEGDWELLLAVLKVF